MKWSFETGGRLLEVVARAGLTVHNAQANKTVVVNQHINEEKTINCNLINFIIQKFTVHPTRELLGEEMHKDKCDRNGGQRSSKVNMEELCREGHEGYGYKGGNGAGPLCLEEY